MNKHTVSFKTVITTFCKHFQWKKSTLYCGSISWGNFSIRNFYLIFLIRCIQFSKLKKIISYFYFEGHFKVCEYTNAHTDIKVYQYCVLTLLNTVRQI